MSNAAVLAVDDNATIRRAISLRLSSKGFRVVTADGGNEALDQLKQDHFDLVLLDLQMPDLSGDLVLQSIREQYTETELPVIMLAASDDKNDIKRTLDLGANDYVVKPGDLPILLARIRTQLSLKQTTEQLNDSVPPNVLDQTSNGVISASETRARNHRSPLRVVDSKNPVETTKPPLSDTLTWEQQQAKLDEMHEQFETTLHDGTFDRSMLQSELCNITHLNTPHSDLDYRVWYDNAPTMCFTLSPDGEIIAVNRFGAHFFGFHRNEITGKSIFELYADDGQIAAHEFMTAVCESPGRPHRWEVKRRKRSGDLIWVRETARAIRDLSGNTTILMNCEDIDETYKLTEKLAHQSNHDELTGLANRKSFEQRLAKVIESARSEGTRHVLAYVDLDQFKIINDTCGHAAGDELIKQIAKLLKKVVRKRDTLARTGGDEFTLLIEDCPLEAGLTLIGALKSRIEGHQFLWKGRRYNNTVSIGVTAVDKQVSSVESVMSMVDTACYAAKDAGRNRVHVYQTDDEAVVARHGEMRWATKIDDALRESRFELNFQRISPVRPENNLGDHYELLIRMRDESGLVVSPGEFLPAAERYNLADKLDRWVISTALDWLRRNPQLLERLHLCSINLSGQSMGNEDILNYIFDQLDLGVVPAEKICFEVTETAAISDLVSATRFITLLKERGCYFALDDFGSGFSSFAYLKNLPVDFLKIDGSFVRDIVSDSIDYAMVRSINEIGHVMGKKTIAEFVEDSSILKKLEFVGVDYVQGYGIGRPTPIAEFPGSNGLDPTLPRG